MSSSLAEGSNTARGRLAQVGPWALGLGAAVVGAVLGATGALPSVDAAVIVGVGVVGSIGLAASLELRARSRIRTDWLDRLHQLADELTSAVEAPDPSRAVRDAADTAAHGVVAPQAMEEERQAFLRSVADQCANAYQRIELERGRQRARSDLELLARASPRLAASLDIERVTETVTELVVPDVADDCRLEVGRTPSAAPAAAATGEDETAVTLEARGRVVGTMHLTRRDRSLTEDELASARVLAEPIARAVDNALRYREEAHNSSTLQHSLLPAAVLPVPGLQIATRYLAATEGQAVGGDFYDVVSRSDDSVVLVVGDVQGKGIEAAALTSAARYTLRSAALDGESPARMLRRVNDLLLYAEAERTAAGEQSVRFVTGAVVALDRNGDGFSGFVASAGHPPPLVIRPDGTIEQVVAEGPLLGVFKDAAYEQVPVVLARSDVLVLYTDGVTERRSQPEIFDEAQLGRLIRNQLTLRDADDVAQVVLDTVMDVSSREARDDIALVVVRATG